MSQLAQDSRSCRHVRCGPLRRPLVERLTVALTLLLFVVGADRANGFDDAGTASILAAKNQAGVHKRKQRSREHLGGVRQIAWDRSMSGKLAPPKAGLSKVRATPPALIDVAARAKGRAAQPLKSRVSWPARAAVAPRGGGAGAGNACIDCEVGEIGCAATESGELGSADCRLEDGSFFDVWRFQLGSAQQVTFELASADFDTFLFLADPNCDVISLNDDCEPGNFGLSCVTLGLSAGTYFLVANSFGPDETGTYTVRASCEEITLCQDCLVGNTACGETKSSQLPTSTCTDPSGASIDLWRFELADPSQVRVHLTTLDFDPVLILLDAECVNVDGNDDCVPGDFDNSCLVRDLEPGSYFLAVTSFEPGESGNYELSVECAESNLCDRCVVGEANCGEPLQGSFPTSDCVRSGEAEPIDLYSFTLADAGPVVIDLTSEEIDPFLRVFNSDCQEIASNDDCDAATLNSCLTLDMVAGDYFLGVSSFSAGEAGNFTLSVACPDVALCRDCQVAVIDCGQVLQGTLPEGTCTSEDGSPLDLYRFGVTEVSMVTANLRSSEFDARLTLLDNLCEPVASNDDCGEESTDSCISRQLGPGDYFLSVGRSAAGEGGSFELELACTPFSPCVHCVVGTVECDATVPGDLAGDDCLLDDGSLFDIWRVTLEEPRLLGIRLVSEDFDTFLFLLDGQCNPIATNDDCGPEEANSCLPGVALPAGTYFVLANSFGPAETGQYSLNVSCRTCDDCGVGSVSCNETVEGTLPSSGCQLPDQTSVDFHRFEVLEPTTVEIQLTSVAFDSFLILQGSDCLPLADNDDCSDGTLDSCLTVDLKAGVYFIGVNSFGPGESGDYTLEVNCGEGGGRQRPGDCNQDGRLNITDAVCLLLHLFGGDAVALPCGDGTIQDPANRILLDFDGSGGINLSDGVALLIYLFRSGDVHAQGVDCILIDGCPDTGCA